MRRFVLALVMAVGLIGAGGLAGCHPAGGNGDVVADDRVAPSYGEVAGKYNARAGKVSKLWARAIIEMDYFDEEKQGRKFEQGEGHLVLLKPDWVALSMGKQGYTFLWAGRNPTEYWLFVLGDDKRAYRGNVANMGKPGTRTLGLPISLDQIMLLSGLEEMPQEAGTVAWEGKQLRVTLAKRHVDMLVDPETWLATQIRVFKGEDVRVMSTLSRPDTVTINNQPPGAFPTVQTNIKISYPGKDDTLTLFLSGLTDGEEEEKINSKIFEFETLVKLLKPGRVVELDGK
jgi:hypothetical protein